MGFAFKFHPNTAQIHMKLKRPITPPKDCTRATAGEAELVDVSADAMARPGGGGRGLTNTETFIPLKRSGLHLICRNLLFTLISFTFFLHDYPSISLMVINLSCYFIDENATHAM